MANAIEKVSIRLTDEATMILGSDWPTAEREFASEELSRIRDCIVVKGSQLAADLQIAESLERARQRFGKESNYYQRLLETMKQVDENWGNKDWRHRLVLALKGYQRLNPEEDDKLRSFIPTKCRSLSSLAEVQTVPEAKLGLFKTNLLQQARFPSAKQVRDFSQTNLLDKKPEVTKAPKVMSADTSGYEDLISNYRKATDTPEAPAPRPQAPPLPVRPTVPSAPTSSVSEGLTKPQTPIVNVSPQQLPPPTTMETLKEVAELLSRHSADEYFVLDAEKVQEIFKDHKQVIDILYDKTNRDNLRLSPRRV